MSRNVIVAKRYAQALFELASSQKSVAETGAQLKLVVDTLESDPAIQKVLSSPSVETARKVELLKGAFSNVISATLLDTLKLIIERRRQGELVDIYVAFKKIADEALGQAQATVYTAHHLSDQELAQVVVQFSQITGKKIIAEQIVDSDLLGGVKVRIGDRLYDGSLSGKLERLQNSLKN